MSQIIANNAIVITAPLEAQFLPKPISCSDIGPTDLLVKTEYSVISAGTELAIFKGLESWAPLPFIPGYGSVGRVIDTGSQVTEFTVGDRIFTYGPHSEINVIKDGLTVRVPDTLDPSILPLAARMGQVAFTSVRTSSAELGDFVVVQGLGLVGNLAAQLFALSGCTVIGIDVSPRRLDAAKTSGITHIVNSNIEDAMAAVKLLTGGAMARVVVEATGIPTLVGTAADFASQGGEVILLGSPRGNYDGNAALLLKKVHEASTNITLKGAHEWTFPVRPVPGIKHSMQRNVEQLLALTQTGRLHVKELISHVITPQEVPTVYQELYKRNEDYFGVIIDWTSRR